MRKGKFTFGGFEAAKKYHLCKSCRHLQHVNWKKEPCPSCKRVGTRQYFMSKKEMERGASLLLLHERGLIRALRFQPRYDLVVNNREIGTYVADAEYINQNGQTIYEDTKPENYISDLAGVKIRLFEALFNVKVSIYS